MEDIKWVKKHLSQSNGYYVKFKTIIRYYKRNHPGSKIKVSSLKGTVCSMFNTTDKYVQDSKGKRATQNNIVCATINGSIYDFVDSSTQEYKNY